MYLYCLHVLMVTFRTAAVVKSLLASLVRYYHHSYSRNIKMNEQKQKLGETEMESFFRKEIVITSN